MSDPNLEELIDWKDCYKENPHSTQRVSCLAKITNGAVLKLKQHHFSIVSVLMNFLSFLVPEGFEIPSEKAFARLFSKCKEEALKFHKSRGRNPSHYENFMASQFFKDPVNASTPNLIPISPNFEPECKRLKTSKKRLEEDFDSTKSELADVSFEYASSVQKINLLEDQIKNLQIENLSLKRKIAGSKASHESKTDSSCNSVKIISQTQVNNIFIGSEGGKENYYVRINKIRKPNSTVLKREIRRRCDFLYFILSLVCGAGLPASNEDKDQEKKRETEVCSLLTCLQVRNASLFPSVSNIGRMSVVQAVNFQSLMRMTTSSLRRMRIILCKLGYDFLPSEPRIRHERESKLSQTHSADFFGDKMDLELVGSSGKVGQVPVLRAKSLISYMSTVVADLRDANRLYLSDSGKVLILFSGDKGGGSMKLTFEVVGMGDSCVFDCHIFCIFEGKDSSKNLSQIMAEYRSDISGLVSGNILLAGHGAKIFLGGDFAFLDAALGHQGSASSNPCNKDHVSLGHLRDHGGKPHTPSLCPTQLRSIDEYNENYSANIAWGSNDLKLNLNKTGKEHLSVVGRIVFPIFDLNRVVPGPLHIKLGITLKLFEMLLVFCRQLDGTADIDSAKEGGEWDKASEALQEKEGKVRTLAEDFVDFINLKSRFCAFLSGNTLEISNIAANSGNRKISKRKPEACKSLTCVMTCYDTWDLWIQCSFCNGWVHAFCEFLSQSDSMGFQLNDKDYRCLKCQGIERETLINYVSAKISDLNEKQIQLEGEVNTLTLRCESYKQEHAQNIGDGEKHLLDKLDELKVVRQAYHGNVFVGNHCKIVLGKYKALCSVISDQVDMHKKFCDIFEVYSQAQSLMGKKRLLSETEITKLRDCCHRFGELFPVLFPSVNLTRKMHELIFHVPRFVEEHKTLGLFSEEDGESLHNVVNQESRSVACLRNSIDKFRHVVERIEVRSKADSSLAEPISRICKKCATENRRAFLCAGMCPYVHLHDRL